MKRILVLVLLGAACATRPAATPAQSLAALESRLKSRSFGLSYDITTSGGADVRAKGTLSTGANAVSIDVTGESAGGASKATYDVDSADIKRAVVAGFIRMGLLHNLVRLLGNEPIEREDVQLTNVAYDPAERKYSFDVVIGGQPTGAAGVWIGLDGLPKRRQQTVNFPGGQMYVEERYTWH